jgi:hypothetical protein
MYDELSTDSAPFLPRQIVVVLGGAVSKRFEENRDRFKRK